MKIYFVRHGETEENLTSISQGQSPGNLSQRGMIQCKQVAKRLNHHHFDHVYCSDLQRTKDSLNIIMQQNNWIIPTTYKTELREIGRGIFEGKPHEEYNKAREESGLSWEDHRPEGGENVHDLRKRAEQFLKTIESDQHEEVLVMAHGGSIKSIIATILEAKTGNGIRNLYIHNTGITKIEKTPKKWIIHYVNDHHHWRENV